MLYTFTGNGSASEIYDQQVARIDAAPEQVQAWLDAWAESLPAEKKDMFDDVDTDIVSLEEVISCMPQEWNAQITEDKGTCLFL